MKKLSAKEFSQRFVDFLKEFHLEQKRLPVGIKLKEEEAIIDLFRLWFMDSREMEAFQAAKDAEEDRGWSDGY